MTNSRTRPTVPNLTGHPSPVGGCGPFLSPSAGFQIFIHVAWGEVSAGGGTL